MDNSIWLHKRNSQCNFDTILQAISLRSQPENIESPMLYEEKLSASNNFGNAYKKNKNKLVKYWSFNFEIMHSAVFNDGVSDMGLLYQDCDKTPMIICNTMHNNVHHYLDISDEYRNIYFEVLENEEYN